MSEKRNLYESPKYCDLSNCHVKKKRSKVEHTLTKIKNGHNILECSTIKPPKRNQVQYLYADPLFIEQATRPIKGRITAGGVKPKIVNKNEDTFYDCSSEPDCNENNEDPMQQQLFLIADVINQIKDPKQFRDLLKEVAYTSYALYRSFRKAYTKTKRGYSNEHKCDYCRQKAKQEKETYKKSANKDQIDLTLYSNEAKQNANLCPICSAPLVDKKPMTFLKKLASGTAQSEDSKLMIRSASSDPHKTDLSIEDNLIVSHQGINEKGSQTQKPAKLSKYSVKEESDNDGMRTNASKSKSCVCVKGPTQDQTKVFYMKPVSISIPLKLQVESENMKPRFIETEIILKPFFDQQSTQQSSSRPPQLLSESAQKAAASTTHNQVAAVTPPDVVSTCQYQQALYFQGSTLHAASDIFYSCISSSGIIESIVEEKPKGEASLNEIFEIIKNRIQMTTDVKATAPPPPPSSPALSKISPQTSQLDDSSKVKSLRDELLQEVKDTLARTEPENVLKPLEHKLVLNDQQTMQKQSVTSIEKPAEAARDIPSPAISSSIDMVTQKNKQNSLPPVQSRASWSRFVERVQEPSGQISETIQTDVTAVSATGHYRRNELRVEIKDDLQELLQPKAENFEKKYEDDERDEILLNMSNLFHPQTAHKQTKQINKKNTLNDIHYILEPPKTPPLQTDTSRTSIVINLRYILTPKLRETEKPPKKIYTKEVRENILRNLHQVLKPKRNKQPSSYKSRESALSDLRFLLDYGEESVPSVKLMPQPSQSQGEKVLFVTLPSDQGSNLLDSNQAATSQPVPPPPPASRRVQIPEHLPKMESTAKVKKPSTPSYNRKNDKVDQAKLNPSSQVVDQTPNGRMDTTKAEGVSLASTLSNPTSSSDTFFAQLQDTLPNNYIARSTLKDTDDINTNNGNEKRKSWLQKVDKQVQNDKDRPGREGVPTPKINNDVTQISKEFLAVKPTNDWYIKSQDKSNNETKFSEFLIDGHTSQSKSRSAKPTNDSYIKSQDKSNNETTYSEFLIDGDTSQSISRSIKPTNDSYIKSQDKLNNLTTYSEILIDGDTSQSKSRSAKPTNDSYIKSQDKSNNETTYSEFLNDGDTSQSKSRSAKPTNDSYIKSQDKLNNETTYSEFLNDGDTSQSKSRSAKPTNDSYIKSQDKLNNETTYSEFLNDGDTSQSKSRSAKPTNDSYIKSQDKSNNETTYSEFLIDGDTSQSISRSIKPTNDSYIKSQEKLNNETTYCEFLIDGENSQFSSQSVKPTNDSYIKSQDKLNNQTTYSEFLIDGDNSQSKSRSDKPTHDSYVKSQDKSNNGNTYSKLHIQVESRPTSCKHTKPRTKTNVNPQEKYNITTRQSDISIEIGSKPSSSRHSNEDISKSRPQQLTDESERHKNEPAEDLRHDLAKLLTKPKIEEHATQRDDIDKSPTVHITNTSMPLITDTNETDLRVKLKDDLSQLFNDNVEKKSEPEPRPQQDLSQIVEPLMPVLSTNSGSLNHLLSRTEVKAKPLKSKDSEQNREQSFPTTKSTHSKLIIPFDTNLKPLDQNNNRKPSSTANTPKNSELIFTTETSPTRTFESQMYIFTPFNSRQLVVATDNSKDHSVAGQPSVPENKLIESSTPKQIIVTNKELEKPVQVNENKTPDYTSISYSRGNPSKPPAQNNKANWERIQVITKYMSMNELPLSKDEQSTQENNNQTTPTYKGSLKTRDSVNNNLNNSKKDLKQSASPEVKGDKPLIYLYSKQEDAEDNKENQTNKANLTKNIKVSISSELKAQLELVEANVGEKSGSQKENLPYKTYIESQVFSQPPVSAPVVQSSSPEKFGSFKTAKAMLLKPLARHVKSEIQDHARQKYATSPPTDNKPKRERFLVITKYMSLNELPHGEDLQSTQDKNKQALPTKKVSTQTRDSVNKNLNNAKKDKQDVFKDKHLASSEVRDDKSLMYLYNRREDAEDSKENQSNNANLLKNPKAPVVTNTSDVKAHIAEKSANQDENLPAMKYIESQLPAIKVDQSSLPEKDKNFKTAKAIVLKSSATNVKPKSTLIIHPASAAVTTNSKILQNTSRSLNDLRKPDNQNEESNHPQFSASKANLRNERTLIPTKITSRSKNPTISTTTLQTTNNIQNLILNIPEINVSQQSPQTEMTQSKSPLIFDVNKADITITAKSKEPGQNVSSDRDNISEIKINASKLPLPKPEPHGTSTASFISLGAKSGQFKKTSPITASKQVSSSPLTAVTDSTTTLAPTEIKGSVTSITIQSKSTRKRK